MAGSKAGGKATGLDEYGVKLPPKQLAAIKFFCNNQLQTIAAQPRIRRLARKIGEGEVQARDTSSEGNAT